MLASVTVASPNGPRILLLLEAADRMTRAPDEAKMMAYQSPGLRKSASLAIGKPVLHVAMAEFKVEMAHALIKCISEKTIARRCRSPSRADKNLDAQVKSAQEAPSRARKYEDIFGAIDILDDVVQMYEVTADKYRRTAAWNRYGKTLYDNILKALERLARLSPKLPSPGLMPAEVKVAENLRTALETIDPKGLLHIMSPIEFGMEGGDVMRLRMRLQPWVTDGEETTEHYLQNFHQRYPSNK